MTKKHYFMLLWALCSVVMIARMIESCINTYYIETQFPLFLYIVFYVSMICVNGIFLFLGMNFASKIGMRFLLLEKHVDWSRDLFKPAVVVSVVYVLVVLVVDPFIPLGKIYVPEGRSFFALLMKLFTAISADAIMLLFLLSGLALFLKKIGKNISVSIIMLMSILLIALISGLSIDLWWRFGVVTFLFKVMMSLVLGGIFWRKGLEAELLCHIIVVIMLYAIAPQLVLSS